MATLNRLRESISDSDKRAFDSIRELQLVEKQLKKIMAVGDFEPMNEDLSEISEEVREKFLSENRDAISRARANALHNRSIQRNEEGIVSKQHQVIRAALDYTVEGTAALTQLGQLLKAYKSPGLKLVLVEDIDGTIKSIGFHQQKMQPSGGAVDPISIVQIDHSKTDDKGKLLLDEGRDDYSEKLQKEISKSLKLEDDGLIHLPTVNCDAALSEEEPKVEEIKDHLDKKAVRPSPRYESGFTVKV